MESKTQSEEPMRKWVLCRACILALLLSWAGKRLALGYIDPNTGGMLFQVLATAFALLSGVALVFSRQIRTAVAKLGRSLRGLLGRERGGTSEQGKDQGG
jgi:hypothetical protein